MLTELDLFPERKKNSKPSFPLGVLVNKTGTPGEVGIEIEVEGKNLPKASDMPKAWLYKKDGSLRGPDNAEYILSQPIPFKDVSVNLKKLWMKFKLKKSELLDSNRTSVHIHLNCQNFHLNRLTALMALYFISEEILTRYCGKHREGNLFCLRAKDATGTLSHIRAFLEEDGNYRLHDGLHYAGFNIQAIQKFGSVEIRTLRGCSDPKIIEEWVEILKILYDRSAEFHDPREICGMFSCNGPIVFFYDLFGPLATKLKAATGWNDDMIANSLMEGIRHAQDLCYCRDWEEFKEITLKDDPFGRDLRSVMPKVAEAVGLTPSGSYSVGLSAPVGGLGQAATEYFESLDENSIPDWDD